MRRTTACPILHLRQNPSNAFNTALQSYNSITPWYIVLQVGDLPPKDVPVLVSVAGTPLVVQRERTLVKGLKKRHEQYSTALPFGHVPLGVLESRTFYVFNTGSLDLQLDWDLKRYVDDDDCDAMTAAASNTNTGPNTMTAVAALTETARLLPDPLEVRMHRSQRTCLMRTFIMPGLDAWHLPDACRAAAYPSHACMFPCAYVLVHGVGGGGMHEDKLCPLHAHCMLHTKTWGMMREAWNHISVLPYAWCNIWL